MNSEAYEVPVPVEVHHLALLDRIDYEDAYRVDTATDQSLERWMRTLIEGAPSWFQVPWITLGKIALGARVGRLGGPEHVLGWQILCDEPSAFAVGMDSAAGLSARLVFTKSPGQVTFSSLIQLDGTRTRLLWPAIRRGHRYFAPYLLTRAAK